MEFDVDVSNVAFVSEFLRDRFFEIGLRPSNSLVISRGIDFPIASLVDRHRTKPPVLFMASRLDHEKGVHVAIDALSNLFARRPDLDWRLEVAGAPGDPGYRRQLDAAAARGGIGERVVFLGKVPREQVLARMRLATAFLSCSRYGEPFAGTIIESLGCGTPLIASKDGSILEVVRNGESALVFERDDASALSQHVESVLTDPELATRLAAAGCRVIEERYTLDRILDQTESALNEVAATRIVRADVA